MRSASCLEITINCSATIRTGKAALRPLVGRCRILGSGMRALSCAWTDDSATRRMHMSHVHAHVQAHGHVHVHAAHTDTRVHSRFSSRYRSAWDRSTNAPLYPHLLPRLPDSHARSAHNPGLRLSLSIFAGLTLARPALAPPAIAPPTIVRCCCCSRRRSRYMYRPCSRRPCSRRPYSRRPCSRRPCSTHVETCGHGGMDRRARQHAGQRMRGGGGGLHEQPKHCERSMESTRIEWWPWRER